MSQAIICDRCRKPFEPEDEKSGAKMNLSFSPNDAKQPALPRSKEDYDLCTTCANAVSKYIDDRIKLGRRVHPSPVSRAKAAS